MLDLVDAYVQQFVDDDEDEKIVCIPMQSFELLMRKLDVLEQINTALRRTLLGYIEREHKKDEKRCWVGENGPEEIKEPSRAKRVIRHRGIRCGRCKRA